MKQGRHPTLTGKFRKKTTSNPRSSSLIVWKRIGNSISAKKFLPWSKPIYLCPKEWFNPFKPEYNTHRFYCVTCCANSAVGPRSAGQKNAWGTLSTTARKQSSAQDKPSSPDFQEGLGYPFLQPPTSKRSLCMIQDPEQAPFCFHVSLK